jgi:hypothetical protein
MKTCSTIYLKGFEDGQYRGNWYQYVVTIPFVGGKDFEFPVKDPSNIRQDVFIQIIGERAFVSTAE